jgi:hypothetical protein
LTSPNAQAQHSGFHFLDREEATAQGVRRDRPLSGGDEDAYESLPIGCDPGAIHRVRIFLLIHRGALA